MSFELFGSLTSPYVRRVRIVASELGVATTLVDTSTEEGQQALRALSPVWKVPAAKLDGQALFDSRVINEHLMRRFGPAQLAALDNADIDGHNTLTVIDAALDALINVFYLEKDGVSSHEVAYAGKQRARAAACLTWLNERTYGAFLSPSATFGLLEIALITSLAWMRFRNAYNIAAHDNLCRLLAAHEDRASVQLSAPPA